jgi:uncharacterized protein (DUF2461 family)
MVQRTQGSLRGAGARRGTAVHPVNAGSTCAIRTAFHRDSAASGRVVDAGIPGHPLLEEQAALQDQYRHQAKDVHSPGYYVHVDPEQVFLGVGMWRPESDALHAIRQRIVARPSEWKSALGDPKFRRHFELGGESLSRPPRGFDKDHELIGDIKRKSFIAVRNLDVEDSFSPQFQRKVEASFIAAAPFMKFLCKAVGVPF